MFSTFDDHNKVFFDFFYLMWLLVLSVVVSFFLVFWGFFNLNLSGFGFIMRIVTDLVGSTRSSYMGGAVGWFICLFILLVITNICGLCPYVFSLTSHLAVNLSIALPVWLSVVVCSISYNMPSFLAHLQPMGSPNFLNPFLCLIELVSLLVRPLTLSVRLTANLSTGHILMGLLGVSFSGSSIMVGLLVLCVGSFYFIFEMAVCIVQSYIFTLLPTLYMDEHPL
nr:ATP synthase F0 subunit 6 [Parantropora penelope]